MQVTQQHPTGRTAVVYILGTYSTESRRLYMLMHAQWLFAGKRPLSAGKVRHLRRLNRKGLFGRCPHDFDHLAFGRALALASSAHVNVDRLHDLGTLELSERQHLVNDAGLGVGDSVRNVGQFHRGNPSVCLDMA